MNLSEELDELTILKNRIARTMDFREKTVKHPKDQVPEKTFAQLTQEIKDLATKATKLKTQIAVANANTIVFFDGDKLKLCELILMQGDIRSELASLKKMLGIKDKKSFSSNEGVFDGYHGKDDDTVYQTNRFIVEADVRILEQRKRTLDRAIQSANWSAEI